MSERRFAVMAAVFERMAGRISARLALRPQKWRDPALRIWFKIMKDNRLARDMTVADDSGETRTHKVFAALEAACYELDLEKPLWLDQNVRDFKRHARTRFTQDSFIEQVDFDFMEMRVIEED